MIQDGRVIVNIAYGLHECKEFKKEEVYFCPICGVPLL